MDDVGPGEVSSGPVQSFLVDACQNCGDVEDLEDHHIVPLKDGGYDIPSNIVRLCRGCHMLIHYGWKPSENNMTLDEFGVEDSEGEPRSLSWNGFRSQHRLDEF